MNKLETLVVPEDLGAWLGNRLLGNSGGYFNTINALYNYWDIKADSPTGDFISNNKKELIEVILGTRGYRIEKPVYHALIKGHELLSNDDARDCSYWNLSTYGGRVFPADKSSKDGLYSTKMTKAEWNKAGINDSNADFVRVDAELN